MTLATSTGDPEPRASRLAAGRARALGLATRGTTAPNRLRRVDRWILAELGPVLRAAADPLVVDLGYGATPVTTVEMAARLAVLRRDLRVVGLEIDQDRVAAAAPLADPPRLTFDRGGFELAGLKPTVVRAMNVLRQYDEAAVPDAWRRMTAAGALAVEGTCDEIGRRGCWFLVRDGQPVSLTLSAHLASLRQPSELAERLPKALISRNVPGEPVHALLDDLDAAWAAAAGAGVFGPRQRWIAAATAVQRSGWWEVLGGVRRWRLGELTVGWPPVDRSR
ncbi:MAG TPA: class I SAM-dependent methyltransferase [Frankiaceae bacterium]|nr:class I SAM-dependent methyltransferase [Frankiaceae bacterium]